MIASSIKIGTKFLAWFRPNLYGKAMQVLLLPSGVDDLNRVYRAGPMLPSQARVAAKRPDGDGYLIKANERQFVTATWLLLMEFLGVEHRDRLLAGTVSQIVHWESYGPSQTFVHEGHRSWSWHVACIQPRNAKTRLLQKAWDRTVQVTASSDFLPDRCEPVLPFPDAFIRRYAMLQEQQLPVWIQNAPHLSQGLGYIRDCTECPCGHDRIDARLVQRDIFRRTLDQSPWNTALLAGSHVDELGMRLDAQNLVRPVWVQRKIHS
jgi:hypothetical protein